MISRLRGVFFALYSGRSGVLPLLFALVPLFEDEDFFPRFDFAMESSPLQYERE
jgi:hypothetical protein